MLAEAPVEDQKMLAADIASYAHDPLGFVKYAFPWGKGDLENEAGPWAWQREILEDISQHLSNPATRHSVYRRLVSSGHGIGKSSLFAWLVLWGLSTFEDTKIVITANTGTQLDTKTQPEIAKWMRMAINTDWWDMRISHIKSREEKHGDIWRADLIPWSEENTAAFQGAHNKGKRMIVLFDEASEIAESIWDAVDLALTDANTEILFLTFGNPTLNHGAFFQAAFGNHAARWRPMTIDARTVEGTNKAELEETIKLHGIDSDRVRVRVLGLFPQAGAGTFIDLETIHRAQRRGVATFPDEPLVVGVDLAWGGEDDNCIAFRCGNDARSVPPIFIRGADTRDPMVMVHRLGDVLKQTWNGRSVAMAFIDSAGIAGPVVARLRALGHKNVMEVNFGADSPQPEKSAYFRDFMWGAMKDWLLRGAGIETSPRLEGELWSPMTVLDPRQRLKLESKEQMRKRKVKSPDYADALALTFAHPVTGVKKPAPKEPKAPFREDNLGWMG